MSSRMMFLDCPAYLDKNTGVRCGLPAGVRHRFIVNSTDGPLESAMIRCPSGHIFNGPIEFLSVDKQASLVSAQPQARILSEDKKVPPESAQVVRAMARKQGFW